MRKLIILLCIMLFSVKLLAPSSNCLTILGSSAIEPYDEIWNAIVQVESSGDPLAYNPVENAVGIVQIRKIRLDDYVKRTGKVYTHEDCYDKEISKTIFLHYATQFHPSQSREIARDWNKSRTNRYWDKVKKHL